MNNSDQKLHFKPLSFWLSHKDMFDKNLQAVLSSYQLIKSIIAYGDAICSPIIIFNLLNKYNINQNLQNARNDYRQNIQDHHGWIYKGFYSSVFAFNSIKALMMPFFLGDQIFQKIISIPKPYIKILELFDDFCKNTSEAARITSDTLYSDLNYIWSEIQKAIYGPDHSSFDDEPMQNLSICPTDLFHDHELDTIGEYSLAEAA